MQSCLRYFIVMFFLVSCSGIHFISKPSQSDLYSSEFIKKIEIVKDMYRLGQYNEALYLLDMLMLTYR